MNFRGIKILISLGLFALLINAFSPGLLAAVPEDSAETVYCPLTKKLQPIRASRKNVRRNPLEEICAGEGAKNSFRHEIFAGNFTKTNHLNDDGFENLVFDFFRQGTAAFDNLPPFPDFPHPDSVKNSSLILGFGSFSSVKSSGKPASGYFSHDQAPRPPNFQSPVRFDFQSIRRLETISRSICPRSPPFSV